MPLQQDSEARKVSNAGDAVLTAKVAAAIAHDINNALTVALTSFNAITGEIQGRTELQQATNDLKAALHAIHEWNKLLFELADYRRPANPIPIDLRVLAQATAVLGMRHTVMHGVRLELAMDAAACRLHGKQSILRRAILNLLLNAAESTGPGGHVRMSTVEAGSHVGLIIDDDGPGVPPDLSKRIFEPFFTTKPNGTGLGLVSVAAAARMHNGDLNISCSPLGGARFELYLASGVPDSAQ